MYRYLLLLAIVSCGGQEHKSTLDVVNGHFVTDSRYRPVKTIFSGLAASMCSSIAITKNIFVTAAHCVCSPINQIIPPHWRGSFAEKIFIHPNYDCDHYTPRDDLALLAFDSDLNVTPLTIATRPLRYGQSVTIVGFGSSDNTGSILGLLADQLTLGVMRAGYNHYQQTTSADFYKSIGIITLPGSTAADQTMASVGPGDSGGALIANGHLVGITSGTGTDPNNQPVSFFASLTALSSRRFLRDAVVEQGFALPWQCCQCDRRVFEWRNARVSFSHHNDHHIDVVASDQPAACQSLNDHPSKPFSDRKRLLNINDTDYVPGRYLFESFHRCQKTTAKSCLSLFN